MFCFVAVASGTRFLSLGQWSDSSGSNIGAAAKPGIGPVSLLGSAGSPPEGVVRSYSAGAGAGLEEGVVVAVVAAVGSGSSGVTQQ